MDDDNGLELSLGLSCGGGSSGKGKGNINNGGNSSDNHKTEGNDRSAKVIDDFKNFLQQTNQRSEQQQQQSSQRSDSQQNFFNDLSKASSNDAETSIKPPWIDEETRKETGNKRKFGFPVINDENKEKDKKELQPDQHEKKTKASHISTATDEGSTADNNEDVAESEVGGSSNLGKEIRPTPTDKTIPDLSKNRGNSSTEEFTNRNISYNFKLQAKETGHGTPSLPQPTGNSANLPVMFGYSPVQLPMLDKDGSGGIIALSQSPFAARTASNSAAPKGEGKLPAAEEGSSEDARGTTEVSDRITADNNNNNTAFTFDFSAIKPGIGADVKFGGSGACPNLPWVSTTGSGPHGRTISGVTYRYNANQIKIVCACHGLHMPPEEFVRHASEEFVSPDSSIGLTAASAHT